MIKLENTQIVGLEPAIRGMRNPMNSWEKSDSLFTNPDYEEGHTICGDFRSFPPTNEFGADIGPNDHDLMMRLAKGGPVHAKYRRMIAVYVDITAPLYWWKEFDTYKVGTVANSCSTMHKIHAKEFTLDDFSHEHLTNISLARLDDDIHLLNIYRNLFINWDKYDDNTKNALLVGVFDGKEYQKKDAWWQMIQLLPSSYNQKRTVMLNYEVLTNCYPQRREHKLDEWREFCRWIEGLPYSEVIIGEREDNI